MSTINTILTNQFFLMFLAIATGLLLGKTKIKDFSLGISGGIFTGIVIGYFATAWAHGVAEGGLGYSNAKRILSQGVVSQPFFTFFLFLFLQLFLHLMSFYLLKCYMLILVHFLSL